MEADIDLKEMQKIWMGSLKSYLIGFFSCIILTFASFSSVIFKILPVQSLTMLVVGLAIVQAIIQSLFFLHVGQEEKPRWETLVFCFMLLILSIVVAGTLWVMNDLDQRMMTPMEM